MRVTPEYAVNLFKEKKFQPIQGMFTDLEHGRCIVGAISSGQLCKERFAEVRLEQSREYVLGLEAGWDGASYAEYPVWYAEQQVRYKQGYDDGKAAYEAVIQALQEI